MNMPSIKIENDNQQSPSHKDLANSIRALSMDAVQKANSGHPGMPMGMADVATVLYTKFLKFDALNPEWADRDRMILSGGHGSMLLYSLNYLTGYEKVTIEQIKNFRQLGALTAGHPEFEPDAGIEMTTGPLGQGISTSIGFAIAERNLNAKYGDELVNHYTYVLCGDGDLMEGISHEACAIAGHMKLSKLIVLYDDNDITIDGSTELSFTEDTLKRFESYGWDTQRVDGHNPDEIEAAIKKAKQTNTPSLISCKTKIGFGSPNKEGTSSCHGSPLGEEEIKLTKERLGWEYEPFEIPENILSYWRNIGSKGAKERSEWETRLENNNNKEKFLKQLSGDYSTEIVENIKQAKQYFLSEEPKLATRAASGKTLEKIVPNVDFLIGGSADLTGSNNTYVKGEKILDANNYGGQYINYGVREHAMAAIMNGLSLHGGIVPYAGTFMSFADYSRAAIRLGALMGTRVIHVMTHDSIGLGEDGPTHQPVEHLASLRAIPNLMVMRPADGIETAECWEIAINRKDAPTLMALTRQGIPTLRDDINNNKSAKGAYIISDSSSEPKALIFATGSEVEIAIQAQKHLENDGIATRVISVPCFELFEEQSEEYKAEILGSKDTVKLAIEAGIRMGWDRFIGSDGIFIGMSSFGASAPAPQLYKHFGITSERIINSIKGAI